MSNDLILVAPGLYFNKTFTCGARKSKTSYGKDDLIKFAKALNIHPMPSKNVDICNEVVKRLKAMHGSHAFAAPVKKAVTFSQTYDCDAKGKNALSVAEMKEVAKSLGIKITGLNKKELCQKIKKKKYGAPSPVASSPSPVQLSKTYDCKSKGKNSINLDKFKKMAKALNITKISGLNKEKLCEKIKKVKFASGSSPTPKAPTPKSPSSSTSPLGYLHGSNFVRLGKNLVFNMDVNCDAKKTKSSPQNYNKDDLLKFANKLGLKLKKTNGESCRVIKEKIKEIYKKPVEQQDSIKSLSPTPKKPLSNEQLVDAIRKCLKLKN